MNTKIVFAAIVSLFAVTAHAEKVPGGDAGLGTYSSGYRMGMLTKCSVKGLVAKSLECQLTMGRESSPVSKTLTDSDGNQTVVQINPWSFSGSPDANNVVNAYVGKYVYVEYAQSQVKSVSRDTDYNIREIADVTKKEPTCTAKTSASGGKSDGKRVGRIVKASNKGTLVKTYEITIQVGSAGNEFLNMSITDEKVYACTLEWLKSGKMATVHYNQAFLNVRFENSSYTITEISPVDDI
jgi:hypothetical protein